MEFDLFLSSIDSFLTDIYSQLQLSTFNLQLFAAEDEGRTEEPTEYKKRKAREEGKVVKTQELPSALILIFGFMLVFIFFKYMYRNSMGMLEQYLGMINEVSESSENVIFLFKPLIPLMIKFLVPVLAVVFIAALLGNIIQVGFQFSSKPIQPDFEKINPNPIRFFTKILFSRQTIVNLAKSVFKISAISVISYLLIRKDIHNIARTMDMSLMQAIHLPLIIAFKLIMVTGGVLLVLSLPDYLFQRFEHIESLKMTKQELKEERKLLEGDPLMRARMRERQREFARRRMMQEVPNADVVITNPTHFAVALKYEAFRMTAPVCIAKGQDIIAQKIKEIARENDVAIVENKPLARELYRRVDIGDEIPDDLFSAVAEVLAFVYKLRKRAVV